MKKFNAKTYQGKSRIYYELKNNPRVSKLWVWNAEKQQYDCPARGKVYLARKYVFEFGRRKRVSCYFENLQEALAWQATVESIASEQNANRSRLTYSQLIEKWKNERWPHLADGTRILYSVRLRYFTPLLDLIVEDTTPSTIDEFIAYLKSDSLSSKYKSSRTSFDKELELLKTIINWHCKMNDETRLVSPFKKRHEEMIQFRKAVPKKFRYMQDKQVELFLETFRTKSPNYFPIAFVQMNQILRISEVCAMKHSNLDLENGTYKLSEHVIWPRVDGREPYIASGTKNMLGETEIPLRSEVVEILRKVPKLEGCDLIFHNNGKLVTYSQMQKTYDGVFKDAQLPFSGTHVLRHTGATQFLNETGDALALTQMGNWKNTDMAMHYGKILKERAGKAVREADLQRNLKLKLGS